MYLQKKMKKIMCAYVCVKSCQGDLNAAATAAAVQISTLEEAVLSGASRTPSAPERQFSLSGAAAQSKHTTSFALATPADGWHADGKKRKKGTKNKHLWVHRWTDTMIRFASLETEREGGKRCVPSDPVAMETQQYCRRAGRCVCVCVYACVCVCLSGGGSRLSVCRCTFAHHRGTHISDILHHQAVTHVQCYLLFSHSGRKRVWSK